MERVTYSVAPGTTCISLNPTSFGVVEPLYEVAMKEAELIIGKQQMVRQVPVVCDTSDVRLFDQFTEEELEDMAKQMKLSEHV